jgi:hypothetical protein
MAFVYRHPRSSFWWMCWVDSQGREQRASSKTKDEAEAKATADELERRARAAAGRRAPAGSLTVERFFDETWLPLRQKIRPWQWKADRTMMCTHFLPHFGSRAIADLATDEGEVALLDWLIALREHPSQRDGTPIASRTVRNIASSVRMFFADAAERKVVRRNPTAGWDADRHLPPVEDKKRGWRARAGFSLEQVVTLTTDRRIPDDRRVLYAMRFLGGPRPGEAANALAQPRPSEAAALAAHARDLVQQPHAAGEGHEDGCGAQHPCPPRPPAHARAVGSDRLGGVHGPEAGT